MQGLPQKRSDLVPIPFWNPTGGLRTDTSAVNIEPNECSACANVIGYEGKLRPRPGLTATLADLGGSYAAAMLSRRQPLTGSGEQVAIGRDTGTNAVAFFEWNGAAWVARTGAATLTASVDTHVSSCSFKGTFYFVTGAQGSNDHLYRWTGTGTNIAQVTNASAAITPFTRPKIILAFDASLFMFNFYDGATALPYGAAWSDFNADDIWRGGLSGGRSGYQYLIDSSEDDTAPITAAATTQNQIIVFKADSIYVGDSVNPPDYFKFTRFAREVGCISQGSLRKFRDVLVFLGDDNVYALEGQTWRPLGDKVRPRMTTALQTSNLQRTVGIVDPYRQLYWLFMPKTSTSAMSKIFIFSFRDNGTWWEGEIANTDILASCVFSDRSGSWGRSLVLGAVNGSFYTLDNSATTDATTTFTPSWTGKMWDAVQMSQGRQEYGEIQRIAVHAGSGKITADVRYGPGLHDLSSVEIGQLNYNGKSDNYLGLRRGGRFLELTLTWDNTDQCLVEGYTLHTMPRQSQGPRGNRSGTVGTVP